MIKEILEAKDVTLYKHLINNLGAYNDRFGLTGLYNTFRKACDNGVKIMPKDPDALAILEYVLYAGTMSSIIQKLLNLRFSDLPIDVRPMMKNGKRKEVAFWDKDGKICDKIIDLINFDGGPKGYWIDMDGGKVQLIDKVAGNLGVVGEENRTIGGSGE